MSRLMRLPGGGASPRSAQRTVPPAQSTGGSPQLRFAASTVKRASTSVVRRASWCSWRSSREAASRCGRSSKAATPTPGSSSPSCPTRTAVHPLPLSPLAHTRPACCACIVHTRRRHARTGAKQTGAAGSAEQSDAGGVARSAGSRAGMVGRRGSLHGRLSHSQASGSAQRVPLRSRLGPAFRQDPAPVRRRRPH